jgi:hypothetical protein
MINCSTIFTQLLGFLPYHQFHSLVGQHKSDFKTQKLTTWNQFVILAYAQATGKDSLREIETGLKTHHELWHHLGIKTVAKSSIAYANKKRNSIVFEKIFYALLSQCKEMTSVRKFSFENPLYSLDSTTVDLCLNLFDWAKFHHTKGAIKLHTLFDNRLQIPVVVEGTIGLVSDIKKGKAMKFDLALGSILVFDRGYADYHWWKTLDSKGFFFVTRPRKNMTIIVSKRGTVSDSSILGDDTIWIGDPCLPHYDKEMRRVRYLDPNHGEYVFITNNFKLTALEIALVYKERWQIELFFKWIKQNLKIKTFLGTSRNAVMSQVWVAMIYYLLVSYIKFQTRYPKSLLELTWLLKETLLTRRPLIDILSLNTQTATKLARNESYQQVLF